MNIITACATYTGDSVNENGLRTSRFELPPVGKNPATPLFIIPSYPGGESSMPNAFKQDTNVLISGRIYPNRNDYKMYVSPVQELQEVPKNLRHNQVNIGGHVGYIREQQLGNCFNFSVMCHSTPLKPLNYTWQDSHGFMVESWEDDAKRLKKLLFVGRGVCLAGQLLFNCYKSKKDNTQRIEYRLRVKGSQYEAFGKSQKSEDATPREKTQVFDSPHQQAMSTPPVKSQQDVEDGIPF
tara:strand:+ start:820 stop:1536 length:717 start_codon:yes stop_codon:yes gene_type:complete